MNWLHHLWFTWFWPSDLGNGPEGIQQTVLYGIIALIFVPPIRRWFKRHIKSIHDKLDHQHEEHLTLIAQHHKEAMRKADLHHAEIMTGQTPPPKNGRDAKGRFIKS